MNNTDPKPNPSFDRLRGEHSIGPGTHEYIEMRDGLEIFLENWLPSGPPKCIVVCFHGAGGHGRFFALFADILAPLRSAVFVADYRGHGLSAGPRGDYPSFQTLLDDGHEVVTHVRNRFPDTPLFVLGDSMGGAMAVNYTAQHPDVVRGMILFSPALLFRKSIPWPQILHIPYYILMALIAPGHPAIVISGNEIKGIRNPLHIEYDRTDPLHLNAISTRYFLQLNRHTSIALKECPDKITAPTILFQGGSDPAIDPAGAREFIQNLAATDKQLVIYPNALHCIIADPEAPDIKERLTEWVEKRSSESGIRN